MLFRSKALTRLPELTAVSNRVRIGKTPLSVTLRGVLGRYTEDAIRGGVRSEVTSGKAEADVTLRLDPQNVNKWLSVDGSVRGVLDAYGANGMQSALGYSAAVQIKPVAATTLRLSYDQMWVAGASPFRFDAISPSSKVGARLTSTMGPLRLSLRVLIAAGRARRIMAIPARRLPDTTSAPSAATTP